MKHKFVCQNCRSIVDWHGSQTEVRIEVRLKSRAESLFSKTLENLCMDCARLKIADLKNLSGAEQGSLL